MIKSFDEYETVTWGAFNSQQAGMFRIQVNTENYYFGDWPFEPMPRHREIEVNGRKHVETCDRSTWNSTVTDECISTNEETKSRPASLEMERHADSSCTFEARRDKSKKMVNRMKLRKLTINALRK